MVVYIVRYYTFIITYIICILLFKLTIYIICKIVNTMVGWITGRKEWFEWWWSHTILIITKDKLKRRGFWVHILPWKSKEIFTAYFSSLDGNPMTIYQYSKFLCFYRVSKESNDLEMSLTISKIWNDATWLWLDSLVTCNLLLMRLCATNWLMITD